MSSAKFNSTLGTITQTNHWNTEDGIVAYEPYVREMKMWASLFNKVNIFAPITTDRKKGNLIKYECENVNFHFVKYNNRIFAFGFLVRFFQFPFVFFQMMLFILKHEVLLIRSPGHFGLMAHLLSILFRKKSITKYAGFFGSFKGERLPSVFERFVIRNFLRDNQIVLVYGESKHPNLISFFPFLMSEREMKEIESGPILIKKKKFVFCSLGRLTKVKGYDLAIKGLAEVHYQAPDWEWEYQLVGDGPEEKLLKELAIKHNIDSRVIFLGKRDYMDAMKIIKSADVLIMPGVQEGWPKVIIEAWLTGIIPVCARAGLIANIIRHNVNGFLFEPKPTELVKVLLEVRKLPPVKRSQMINYGKSLAQQYSTDNFERAIYAICRNQLKIA
ncbi:MAG: glycosyltransferase [Flavobacteriales bacterium]|nr:glycosyltransferase [Flavobacteriales bacterium]